MSLEDRISLGNWEKETDSQKFLEDLISQTGLFNIYTQIPGKLLFLKNHQEQRNMIIDLVISPKKDLLLAGWDRGPIGIECKKSGVKINHAFAQTFDYSNTIWRLPNGFLFMCEYYFLWPFEKMAGFAASQMAQTKIGTLSHQESGHGSPTLRFFCGETKVMKIYLSNNSIEVGNLNFGNKTGSR